MPRKNVIKTYVENTHYHLYNRGVDKNTIYKDKKDYIVFLRFLKEYLLPPNHKDLEELNNYFPNRKAINCFKDIELVAYCLMPNHFHLLVKQKTKEGLKPFMKALSTNYSMYFNHKYDRVGPLYQGTYKAVIISGEPQFLHLTRYIHRNPLDLVPHRVKPSDFIQNYPYSSYKYYLNLNPPDWLKFDTVISYFNSASTNSLFNQNKMTYQIFVENFKIDDKDKLGNLALD